MEPFGEYRSSIDRRDLGIHHVFDRAKGQRVQGQRVQGHLSVSLDGLDEAEVIA